MQKPDRRPVLILLLSHLGFLAVVSLSPVQAMHQGPSWDDVISAFDRFLDDPSAEKAASLARLLPKDIPSLERGTGDRAAAFDHIFAAENFGILATEATLGNKGAIVALLRLLNIADGFGAEEISGALGQVARYTPKLFLEVMRENWDMSLIRRSGPPVDDPPYAYNNHLGAFRFDLEKRIEALRSVEDPKLADIKEACLKRLVETLKKLK